MKLLKKLQILILGLALSGKAFFSANAQQKMTPDQRVAARVQKMKDNLNLTPDQVGKITTIYSDAQQKMTALRNSGADPASTMQQRKEINKNAETQVSALLTPEQITKWKAMKEQMKSRRMQQGGAPGGGGQPEN